MGRPENHGLAGPCGRPDRVSLEGDWVWLFADLIVGACLVAAIGLLGFALHRLLLIGWYALHRAQAAPLPRPISDADCPQVLVQLPVWNEPEVMERLLDSIASLDWPSDRLSVQVLDDSTDETPEIVDRWISRRRNSGLRIEHLRRTERLGWKAGALAAGLSSSSTPFVAIFDADFQPSPDFLRHAVPPFLSDSTVGLVQARWGHQNANENSLTRASSLLLDGHFVFEHGGRFRSGRFWNFNGTAGVWRRSAIEDSGGWMGDTLCEDLDLSYRAQLRGWKFIYLQALVAPADLPTDVLSFRSQQHRWAKGSLQVAAKLLPSLLSAPLSIGQKTEALAHLLSGLAAPLLLLWSVLHPFAIAASPWALRTSPLLPAVAPLLVAGTVLVAGFYALAGQRANPEAPWSRIASIPLVLALGVGLSVNGTRAALEAFSKDAGGFSRTPKGPLSSSREHRKGSLQPWLEIALGFLQFAGVGAAVLTGRVWTIPFLVLFAVGFLTLGRGSLPSQAPSRRAHEQASVPS